MSNSVSESAGELARGAMMVRLVVGLGGDVMHFLCLTSGSRAFPLSFGKFRARSFQNLGDRDEDGAPSC
jgi:hypothetical protein